MVVWQWGYDSFNVGVIFIDVVVEVFQIFFDIGNGGVIKGFVYMYIRSFEVLFQYVIFY